MKGKEIKIEDLIEIKREHDSMIGWTFFMSIFLPAHCVFIYLYGCLLHFTLFTIFNVDVAYYLTRPDEPILPMTFLFSYCLLWWLLVIRTMEKSCDRLQEIFDNHCSEEMFNQAEAEMNKDITINKENAELLYYVRAHFRKGNTDRAKELFFRLCGKI